MSVEPSGEFHRVVCVPVDALTTMCDAYTALTGGTEHKIDAQRVLSPPRGPSLAAADEAFDVLTAALPAEGE